MTHLSRFRYGAPLQEPPTERRGCSEVRVSYFDPATGKPCKDKPKPLKTQSAGKPSSYERNAKRMDAIEEATEIMRNMKARNAKERKEKNAMRQHSSKKRPVLVDGVLFPSVAAAAIEVGTTHQYLGNRLLAGAKTIKGRNVEFAEVVE